MRRREFVTLLAGAATAAVASWSVSARAEPSGRIRRIGVLTTFGESDTLAEGWLAAFRRGLDDLDWHDKVRIEYRRAAGDADRLQAYAKELVALQPDVIF